MVNGLPMKAKATVPGKSVTIDPGTYLLGVRMERNGMLRPGQAIMLAATLPNKAPAGKTKGRKK